ncbi:3-hydroxybutyrate dehydrogenase [uncultured Sphingomonas sp.]|uniref:3-hydroxybutyrate dehydrogenase n=1 Tax=uncultured Sphingomonas sp. TaxID=158754 RepID=UPI0025D4D21E|nr:3-hydroxybutyrate dehydrogenase [uncultured Sphingomonas sp.]
MILQGKTAVITGSTSGIGLAYAKALAAEGASLVINGFGDADAIEAIRAELAATSGATALYDAADMTKPDQIAALIDRAVAETGRIDIAINNAGIQHVSPIEDFPDDKMEAIVRINMTSAWHVMKAVVPHMKARGWGRIISTASAHSQVASSNKSAYVMAKHGLVGLTKTVALETATHGITVNCISPGYVWTPLVEAQIPDTMKARRLTREQVMNDVLLAAQPTKEFVTPEQVAALALFLCRDEAKAITGANLSVDGGWTAA